MTIYEHKLKNAYIGGYVEETYTFSGIGGAGDYNVLNPISKSGYNVQSVVIEGSGNVYNPSYSCGMYLFLNYDTTRTYELQLSFNIGSNNTGNYSGVRYRTGGSNIDEYDIRPYINYTSTNTYKMTWNRTGWLLTINGTNLSGTYSSGMKSIVDAVMNSPNIQFKQSTTYTTTSTQTVTVTYIPNS